MYMMRWRAITVCSTGWYEIAVVMLKTSTFVKQSGFLVLMNFVINQGNSMDATRGIMSGTIGSVQEGI